MIKFRLTIEFPDATVLTTEKSFANTNNNRFVAWQSARRWQKNFEDFRNSKGQPHNVIGLEVIK